MNNENKWVKCSDILPENAQKCLVYTRDKEMFAAEFISEIRTWFRSLPVNSDEQSFDVDEITHWMAIENPQPPEQENES